MNEKFSVNPDDWESEYRHPEKGVFLGYSPERSSRYQDKLQDLRAQLSSDASQDDLGYSMLVLSTQSISGKSLPSHGIIGLDERILQLEDQKKPLFILAHERVHLQVGAELRRSAVAVNDNVDRFFHSHIIPEWLEGKTEFILDNNYVPEKRWNGLYEDWLGPSDINLEKAREAVNNYFLLLTKGLLKVGNDGKINFHITPSFPKAWDEVGQEPDKTPEELYANNPKAFTTFLLTGYELADYLRQAYRDKLSRKLGVDLWELEEGFANYVASKQTSIPLRATLAFAPQDEGKIRLAELIAEKIPSTPESSLSLNSYEELANFYQKLGLIRDK